MAKTTTTIPVTGLILDRSSAISLSRQLAERLREQILAGQLGPGFRLPSTRALAAELAVSRNTTRVAYDQLLAEGYVEGRVGAGTTVARVLPETFLSVPAAGARGMPVPAGGQGAVAVSRRGLALTAAPAMPYPEGTFRDSLRPFRGGVPAVDAFPYGLWGRLVARRARQSLPDLMAYQEPTGYRPLREAIASYLGTSRGVRCTADQVVIVAGSQGGLDLAGRVLLDSGEAAWVEDPGYPGARGALVAAGVRPAPIPVDADGLDPAVASARCPEARLAYVTPSHQFPLGATMTLARRLALLDWAARTGAWIVEDDYNGEFRYAGRPLPALQGLRPDGRVVYLGSFSKVFFPALRLGYLVAPLALVDAFVAARRFVDVHPPALEQAVLADFIAEGHFGRHIRRMRTLYAARAQALIEAAGRDLVGLLEIGSPAAGLHTVGWLAPGVDDQVAAQRAAAHGVWVQPVSHFAIEPLARGGLLLGFAAVDAAAIADGTRRLAAALRSLR